MATAAALVGSGLLTPAEAVARYDAIGERVRGAAERALSSQPLTSAAEVMAPLAPRHPERVAVRASTGPDRAAAAGGLVTLAQAVNLALGELLGTYPGMCVFGEDVGRKGGVYGVTKGLQRRFGPAVARSATRSG